MDTDAGLPQAKVEPSFAVNVAGCERTPGPKGDIAITGIPANGALRLRQSDRSDGDADWRNRGEGRSGVRLHGVGSWPGSNESPRGGRPPRSEASDRSTAQSILFNKNPLLILS